MCALQLRPLIKIRRRLDKNGGGGGMREKVSHEIDIISTTTRFLANAVFAKNAQHRFSILLRNDTLFKQTLLM